MNKNLVSFEALHTHTHTSNLKKQWSKGGSREHSDVVILPRDCE